MVSNTSHSWSEFQKIAASLLEKLDRLGRQCRLISGNHINLTETDAGIVIEANDYQLPDALKQWILEADQKLETLRIPAQGKGIRIEDNGVEWVISAETQQTIPVRHDTKSVEEFSFPFRVTAESLGTGEYQITVQGNNYFEGRHIENLVFIGTRNPLRVEETTFISSTSVYVFCIISYLSSTQSYSIQIKTSFELPTPLTYEYLVPLAHVNIDETAGATVVQMHMGNIYVTGRIV